MYVSTFLVKLLLSKKAVDNKATRNVLERRHSLCNSLHKLHAAIQMLTPHAVRAVLIKAGIPLNSSFMMEVPHLMISLTFPSRLHRTNSLLKQLVFTRWP